MGAKGRKGLGAAFSLVLVCLPVAAAGAPRQIVAAASELRGWDARIDGLVRSGDLRLRLVREDTLLPGRVHERFTQLYKGVPVFGGELARQSDPAGALSVFGSLFEGIDVDTRPTLSAGQALRTVEKRGAVPYGSEGVPELVVLPKDPGGYVLAWRLRASVQGDVRMVFIDARDGSVAREWSDVKRQSVGGATGVLGDKKKMSAASEGGGFVADDKLRPPAIFTYDFKGDILRLLFLPSFDALGRSDLAADADNTWTDGADVDAHVYAGYVYDYYFKRFGRRGLDNNDIAIRSIVHPANRDDFFAEPNAHIPQFYVNAGYYGDGVMLYGEGLPPGLTFRGQHWNYTSGGLDIVGHELTHGVTDYSSRLVYQGESGALNESFSDMMGTSVEFFHQPPGDGPLKADYLIGEDVITPGGIRSLKSPGLYGDPDHYSQRYTGPDDGGGVHSNSAIGNQAFYLAIEGGTNPVSGIRVAGVGGNNREQIEKTFYRAFTQMLPPSANYATARAATIQSARDLYGAGSAAEGAVTQAWAAVGVN